MVIYRGLGIEVSDGLYLEVIYDAQCARTSNLASFL